MCCRSSIAIGLLFFFGVCVAVASVLAIVYWPTIFSTQVNNQLALTNTSQSFGFWKETPIPMYMEFYLWDVTNYQDILDGNAKKVILEQKGPYVYRESHTKVNIKWNEDHTVTFNNKRTWHFIPEMSKGTLEDEITNVNVILATIGYILGDQCVIKNRAVDLFVRAAQEHMFVTTTVRKWIFEGYHDHLLDLVDELNHILPFPIKVPFKQFGWFVDRNDSATFDGTFKMHTGTDNIELLGELSAWNYKTSTGCYSGDCGRVQGSMGELWRPEYDQNDITVFASELCGHMTLHKAEEVTVDGIIGVRYRANNSLFDNGYHYHDMACYCDNAGHCPLPGVRSISKCRFGSPAFVSQPHFRNADPYYTSNIVGMAPKTSHDFLMGLELFTGIPIEVQAQLQINILISRVPGFSILNILPADNIYVPMFWFRQTTKMTEEFASLARSAQFWHAVGLCIFVALFVVGLVLLVVGFVVLVKKLCSNNGSDTVPLL